MINQIKSRYSKFLKLAKLSSTMINEFGFRYFILLAYSQLKKNKLSIFSPEPQIFIDKHVSETTSYASWLAKKLIAQKPEATMREKLQTCTNKPKLDIILSINDKNKQYLKESLHSLFTQIYENWRLHLTCSPKIYTEIQGIVDTMLNDHNIAISKPKHAISLKDALASIDEDFVMFVNCGSILTRDAFFNLIQFLNKTPDADIIYSDEDEITNFDKRINPFFKPNWSPDLFLSCDYISNFYIVRSKSINESISSNEQHQEAIHYDFLLRLTEKTKKIFHIPIILVSIRKLNDTESTINFDNDAIKSISDVLVRRGIDGKVSQEAPSTFRIKYSLHAEPKVSIIIPTKDNLRLLKRCITFIEKTTSYKNYEIIIIDNGSVEKETVSYLKSLPYKVIKYDLPFNFSKMNNLAVSHSDGEYILFLNDDAAPLRDNWLTEIVSIGQQEEIGIVGPKLVHEDTTIQHAGIVFSKTGTGFHPYQGVDANSTGYFGFLNMIRNYSAVTGACLLIKKKIFYQVGGFDELLDLYYGDTDLCLKVIKQGYRVVYTPYAVLLHRGSSKIKEHTKNFYAVENYYRFIKKWPYLKDGDPFYNQNLAYDYRIDTNPQSD